MPKSSSARTPRDSSSTSLPDDLVDGALRDAGEAVDLVDDAFAGTGEERHHEPLDVERGLAHERAQRVGPAEAPQAGDGKGAHGVKRTPAWRRRDRGPSRR